MECQATTCNRMRRAGVRSQYTQVLASLPQGCGDRNTLPGTASRCILLMTSCVLLRVWVLCGPLRNEEGAWMFPSEWNLGRQ